MKMKKIEIETAVTHHSHGITTWGLLSAVMLSGHIFAGLSLWFLPVTIALAIVSFGFEIQPRQAKRPLHL